MRLRLILPILAGSVVLFGCGKNPAGSTAPTGAPTRQVLNIGNHAEPQDLDPQAISGIPEHTLVGALFEGLVTEDPKDLHPVPGVAESWDISADGRVYTFKLRPNAKWSNGTPLTADDFVRSYQRMLSPKFAAEYAYLLYNVLEGAKAYYDGQTSDFGTVGVKAVDPHTLEIRLKNPTPFLLQVIASHYAWGVVPVDVILQHGALEQKRTNWTRLGNLVGNGAFRLKEWVPNQRIVMDRNPHYWDAANVKLDEVVFHPVDDYAAEERMFRTGQLDLTYEFPNAKIDTYRRDYPDALRMEPYLGVYFFRCNVARPPLSDKRVRQALALAVDREALVKHVMRGGQEPAYALTYPGVAGYTPLARLQGSVAEAKRLLADAGFPDGRGLPEIPLIYNASDNNKAVAEAVQDMWKRNLGVTIRLENQDWKTYLDVQDTKNFTLQRAGWIADYVDPHVFLELWETNSGNNDSNWGNAEYDRLLQQALAAPTLEERYALYQKMDAILVDELPAIPLFYYTTVRAVSPKVRGYHPTLLDHHPLKHLWIGD